MKKTLVLALLALVVVCGTVSAKRGDIGIGVEYVFSFGSAGALNGITITGSPPVLPIVFGLNFGLGGQALRLGVTADWWLWQTGVAGPLYLYAGPGLFVGMYLADPAAFSFGARAVIALQLFLIDPLEIFAETGVNVGVSIAGGGAGLDWGIPIAVGGRFWF